MCSSGNAFMSSVLALTQASCLMGMKLGKKWQAKQLSLGQPQEGWFEMWHWHKLLVHLSLEFPFHYHKTTSSLTPTLFLSFPLSISLLQRLKHVNFKTLILGYSFVLCPKIALPNHLILEPLAFFCHFYISHGNIYQWNKFNLPNKINMNLSNSNHLVWNKVSYMLTWFF